MIPWPDLTSEEWLAEAAKLRAVTKFNPYHRGEGPGGGQFTNAEGAGGAATAGVRDAATATAPASGGRRLDRKFGAFHDAETRILRQRDHETGMVLERADGTPGPSRDGQARSVEYTPEEVADMKGAVFSHNHPSGSAFSPDDMAMMVQAQLREMRAVGIAPDGRGVLYRARPPADIDARIEALTTTLEAAPRGSEELYIGRKMRQTLRGESGIGGRIIRRDGSPVPYRGLLGIAVGQRQQSFIDKANAYYTSKWSRRVKSGMTEDEATRLTAHEHYHRAVQKVARELGITYTRTYFTLPPEAEIEKALPNKKPETGVRFIDGGFMLWDGLPDYAALAEELDLSEVEGDDEEDDEEVEVEKIDPPTILYPGAGLDVPRRTNPPLSDAGQQRRAEAAGNYRRALQEGDRAALARIFRDRRSDRLIQRLLDGDATLDAEQIDRLVEHYERRYGRHLANVEDITAQRIAARDRLRGAWERLADRPDVDRRRITKTWITAQDERVRDAHAAMDGMTIPFDELFPAPDTGPTWSPPAAFNCVAAPTRVRSGPFRWLSRRRFDGEMVTVETADGDNLTVTPNHPVLTPSGLRAAHLLREGDHLVRCGGDGGGNGLARDHQFEDVPVLSDVFEALAPEAVNARRGQQSPVVDYFHGDVSKGEIEVVWPARQFCDGIGVKPPNGLEDEPLGPALTGTFGAAQHGVAGGGVGVAPPQHHRLTQPTRLESVRLQDAEHGSASDADLFGDTVDAAALPEVGDDTPLGAMRDTVVTHVRRSVFAGWVYNLETLAGWYVAANIVSGNCRCYIRFNYEDAPVESTEGAFATEGEAPPVIEPRVGEPLPDELTAEAEAQLFEELALELARRADVPPGAEDSAQRGLQERVQAVTDAVLRFARTRDLSVAYDVPAEVRDLPARLLREWVRLFERFALQSGDAEWAQVAATAAVLARRAGP